MQTTGKNLGGAKAWTTLEQKTWLTERMPDYVASRSSDSKTNFCFWPPIFEAWFAIWLIRCLVAAPPKNVVAELVDGKKIVSSRGCRCWYDSLIVLLSRSKSGTGLRTTANEPKRWVKVGFAS